MDFSDILQENLYGLDQSHVTYAVAVDSGSNGQSVSFVPFRPRKCKVVDLGSWLETWNTYMRVFIYYHTHMLNPLLAYQSITCNFSRKFRPSDWLNYDLAFHRHASINHVLQWDSYDEDAYDPFLRDHGISSCYGCGKPGHFLNNCQAKSTMGSSSSTSSIGKPVPNGVPTTSGGSSPVTPLVTRPVSSNFCPNPDTQPEPCIRYNKTGYCKNPICFTLGAHFCNKPNCRGPHPGVACPR